MSAWVVGNDAARPFSANGKRMPSIADDVLADTQSAALA